jgi:hypothetical protein
MMMLHLKWLRNGKRVLEIATNGDQVNLGTVVFKGSCACMCLVMFCVPTCLCFPPPAFKAIKFMCLSAHNLPWSFLLLLRECSQQPACSCLASNIHFQAIMTLALVTYCLKQERSSLSCQVPATLFAYQPHGISLCSQTHTHTHTDRISAVFWLPQMYRL